VAKRSPSPDATPTDIGPDKDASETRPRKKRRLNRALPSPDPNTNALIADIVVRGASLALREKLQDRMLIEKYDPEQIKEIKDGRGIVRAVGLYGASRLATRSVPGLLAVVGGLAVKSLYDRGRDRQRRERNEKRLQAAARKSD
jgi:hypothetical protein